MTIAPTKNKRKEDVFNALLAVRIGFYKLMDLEVWNDDHTRYMEEDLLSSCGYEIDDYDHFRNSESTESWNAFKKNFFGN